MIQKLITFLWLLLKVAEGQHFFNGNFK